MLTAGVLKAPESLIAQVNSLKLCKAIIQQVTEDKVLYTFVVTIQFMVRQPVITECFCTLICIC